MKFTDVISNTLKRHGVCHAFGLQGGAVVHIFDSLERSGVTSVYTLHEQAAGLAGVAYARTHESGLGCVVTTTGPGSTNAITGLLAAWNDSIPCIFISGQARSSQLSYGKKVRQVGTQEAPICDIVRPISKRSFFVSDPDEFQIDFENVINEAKTGRPGPVWIDVPLEYQWRDIPYDPSIEKKQPQVPVYNESVINTFLEYLSVAERPLFLLGNGIRLSGSEASVQALIQQSNIPFVTTWTGQDLFETNHDRNLGVIGMAGQKGANKAVFDSDLLICLGSHLAIPHTTTLFESYATNTKKIIVNIDSDQIENLNVPFDLTIHADLREFLDRIIHKMDFHKIHSSLNSQAYKDLNWYDLPNDLPNSNEWNRRVTKQAGPNSCFVVDGGGTALYTGFQSTLISTNNQRIVCSSTMSAMGTGLAETVGAFFSGRFEKLYCIIGDGSFSMNVQDLHTIVQHNIPVTITVVNNNGYLAIRHTQQDFQDGRYFGTHPEWGLSLPNVESIASAFGVPYIGINSVMEMDIAIERANDADGPSIFELFTDENQDMLFKQKYRDNGDGTYSPIDLYDMQP